MRRECIISGNEGELKMGNNLERLSKKSIAILLIIIPLAWFASTLIVSLISPTESWPPSLPLSVAGLIPPMVLVGFSIYGMNLRDERASQISDKATRNGFAFVLCVIPLALIVLSLTGASFETVIALVMVWIGTVAVASISAFYYYYK
jgi:L-asparagine transporter-like permease